MRRGIEGCFFLVRRLGWSLLMFSFFHGYDGIVAVVRVRDVAAEFQTACENGFTGASLRLAVSIMYWVRRLRRSWSMQG